MESNIEKLFNIIIERQHKWDEYRKLFGENHYMTDMVFRSLDGLEEAFNIIAGHSFTEHLINKCKQDISAISQCMHYI